MAVNLDYEKSKEYWTKIKPTVDGMLGGFSVISAQDISGSLDFIHQLGRQDEDAPNLGRALDVGAGIGRVSKYLLTKNFKKVDLLEQNEKFLNEAKKNLQSSPLAKHIVDNFFCSGKSLLVPNSLIHFTVDKIHNKRLCLGLKDFTNPDNIKYDVIWIQWVLLYLNDEDVVEFLKRCV